MTAWSSLPIAEFAEQLDRSEKVHPDKKYTLLGMRSKIGGPFARETKAGAEISAKTLNKVAAGDFIYSRLFAWQGSFGIVPEELDGCYVSNEFPIFKIDRSIVEPEFLVYFFGLPRTQKAVEQKCHGSTPGTRNRFKEIFFFRLIAPIPSLNEQRRIVSQLDRVTELVSTAKEIRSGIDQDTMALVERLHFDLSEPDPRPLADFIELFEDRTFIEPDGSYPQVGLRGFAGGLFLKDAISGTETSYKTFNRLHTDLLIVSQPKGWEGAVAVCEEIHAGWFASPEYRTFRCRDGLLDAEYLRRLIETPWFQHELTKLTRGQGARRERLRPEMLLGMTVQMPSLGAQKKANKVIRKIREIRALKAPFDRNTIALMPALLHEIFGREASAA